MSATFRFDGKRVLITGAGKGLGRALAKRLHGCGAIVIALSRTKSDLDNLKAELPGLITLHCDIADWQKTRKAVESVLPIHHLVNNAAIGEPKPFMKVTEGELTSNFGVNFNAIINISQVVASDMIARKEGGAIVNLSSIASKVHLPNFTTYCSTKAALNMLTKSMGNELAPHNIRVNAVLPTRFPTVLADKMMSNPADIAKFLTRHPMGRYPNEENMVDAILFLLSDLSRMMVGTETVVDSGLLTH